MFEVVVIVISLMTYQISDRPSDTVGDAILCFVIHFNEWPTRALGQRDIEGLLPVGVCSFQRTRQAPLRLDPSEHKPALYNLFPFLTMMRDLKTTSTVTFFR